MSEQPTNNEGYDPFVTMNDGDSGIDTSVTQSGDEYTTRGKVRVVTRVGHAFNPSNKDLPVIDHSGVLMTREQADEVMQEANNAFGDGYVSEVPSGDTDEA